MDINNNKKDPVNLIGISGKMGSGKDLVGQIIQYLDFNSRYRQCTFEEYKNIYCLDYNPKSNGWQIRKFADKLKDIVCLLIGCTRQDLEDREFKEKELGEEWQYYKVKYDDFEFYGEEVFINLKDAEEFYENLKTGGYYANLYKPILMKLTPRKLLQLLGTEYGRQIIHPNIWCNALFSEYKSKHKFIGEQPKVETIHSEYYYPNWLITDTRFENEAQAIKARNGIIIRVNRPCKECGLLHGHKISCSHNKTEHESETALDNYQFDYVIDNNGTIEELIEKVKEILIKEKIISYES